jgi:hypothetical protein
VGFRGVNFLKFHVGYATIRNLKITYNPAVAHDQAAFAVLCDVELVRDHDNGDALIV